MVTGFFIEDQSGINKSARKTLQNFGVDKKLQPGDFDKVSQQFGEALSQIHARNSSVTEELTKFHRLLAFSGRTEIHIRARRLLEGPRFYMQGFRDSVQADEVHQECIEVLERAGDFIPWSSLIWRVRRNDLSSKKDFHTNGNLYAVIAMALDPPVLLSRTLQDVMQGGVAILMEELPAQTYEFAIKSFEHETGIEVV
jgi:hypothetical protein